MGLTLLVWVGGGLIKRVVYFFGNEPSLGRKSSIKILTKNQGVDNLKLYQSINGHLNTI